MKRIFGYWIVFFLLGSATALWSQKAEQNELKDQFQLVELAIKNYKELGLTRQQRETLLKALEKAESNFTRWRLDLDLENRNLTFLLKTDLPEEAAVLSQLDKVLEIEKKIKKERMKLLILIKNMLSPKQEEKAQIIIKNKIVIKN